MKAAIHHGAISHNADYTTARTGLWQRFIAWAESQEDRRIFWTALSLVGHGTFFTIITFATVILTGNEFALLAITCVTMMLVLAVNLAALPAKYIIPIFFGSLLVDVLVMITALLLWVH